MKKCFLTFSVLFLLLLAEKDVGFVSLAQARSSLDDCLFRQIYQLHTDALTTPARNLTTAQALDMVAYLASRGDITLIDEDNFLQFDSNCQPIPPQTSATDATSPRVGILAVVSGVHFVYDDAPTRSHTLQDLDPAMVVFLYRLANHLKAWGVTEIHTLGIGQPCPYTTDPCKCGQHQLGRAIDFTGVVGEIALPLLPNSGGVYSLNVSADWGMQSVLQPGSEPYLWKPGVATSYRLQSVEDLSTPEQVHKFLAYSIFLDVYNFATGEAVDTGRTNDPPTTLGQSSVWILHPDYRTDTQDEVAGTTIAESHNNHMHIEIGPSCRRKAK